MITYEWPGFILISILGLALTLGPLSKLFPKRLRSLIVLAFLIRVGGVLLRHWVIYGFYETGDAAGYYRFGLFYAEYIAKFDFSFIHLINLQFGRLWGTAFVTTISAFILSLIGPSQRAEFLVFSSFSLLGLLLFCKAFQKNFPNLDPRNYARWILLWPSLWFWTSSVGKDALVLLATALTIYGYTGKGNRIHWISMLFGILLASFIRPHVAGVLVVSMAIAHWITPGSRWTFAHVLQGIGIVIVMAIVIRYGFQNLGLTDIDPETIKEYVELVSEHSTKGGGEIVAPGITLIGIPLAFINIFFRPFPWEVSHPLMAAASVELILFWCVFWARRKRIIQMARQWRSNRLLRLAVPLILLYTLMLGVAVGNLGIIARQRVHIMPLLFIWLEAVPQTVLIRRLRFIRQLPGQVAGHASPNKAAQ